MITAASDPVLSGVYKMVAIQEDGQVTPKIKLSNTIEKTTIPGFKHPYRMYDAQGKARGDLLLLADEKIRNNPLIYNSDPNKTIQTRRLKDWQLKPLHEQIFAAGKLVYQQPTTLAVKSYSQAKIKELPESCLRLKNPDIYDVFWSKKVRDLRSEMIDEFTEK